MTQSHISVRLNDEGDLVLEGQGIGQAPLDIFGKDEYEYFVTVPLDQKDALLLQLVRDRFLNGPTPSSNFMAYLKEHAISYSFESW